MALRPVAFLRLQGSGLEMFLPRVVAVLGAEPCEKTRRVQSCVLPSLCYQLCGGRAREVINYRFYYEWLTLICPDLSTGTLVELISKA